ncbi:MAG: GDSL-type esterase/lipase family protein [Patescibacteria group bacterium]
MQHLRWYGVVALIVLLGGWYVYATRERPVANYPSAGTDIIAFGDSLVAGSGASPGNDFISLLSRKIGRPIINLGVSGDTTADGLARVNELDQYQPKIVLLLLGGNDHLRRVPAETTFTNLATLIEAIQARGAIVLLLGVKGNLIGDSFASAFEELRDTYHTAYVSNVLGGLFGNSQYMADAIHPNDAGYAVIADRIYPVLLPLLSGRI